MNSSENSCNISSLDRPSLFTDESISAPNSSAATPLATDTDTTDAKSKLKLLRIRNIGRVIIGYLNINSVRNKFDALKEIASQSLDVLMIAETKLDATFPTGQFAIEGFAEGQITDFFSYTFLEITKKSHTKITKSQINYLQKAQKITNH